MFVGKRRCFYRFQYINLNGSRPAAEPSGVIPEEFPCIVDHYRNNGGMGFNGQLKGAVLEIVQVRGEFVADMTFRKDGYAAVAPEDVPGPFKRLESRYVALSVQRDIDGPEEKTGNRIAEKFDFPHKGEVGRAQKDQRGNIEVGRVVGTDDAGLGPIDRCFVAEPVADSHTQGTKASDEPPALSYAGGVPLGVPCPYQQ